MALVSSPIRLLDPPQGEAPPPERSDLGLSFEIGLTQMEGVPAWLQGAGASLLDKVGLVDAARGQRMAARRTVNEMYDRIHELESLYSGPHSWAQAQEEGTIGSYAMWGINEAVKQVPNLATMAITSLGTMGFGTLLFGGAKAGARFAVANALKRMPGAKYTLPTGETARSLSRGSATAGVILGSALLNTGEIYSSALAETGESNPAVTGLAGLLAGSLDMWPGSKIVRSMGKGQEFGSAIANKFLRDKKWRSRLYRSLELGATEALVEDWQTVIEAFTVNYLNDNRLASDYVGKAYGIVPITADQVAERMEARAAGALLGTLLGPFGRVGGRRVSRDAKITIEELRQLDEAMSIASASQFEEVIPPGGVPPVTPRRRPGMRAAPITDLIKTGLPLSTVADTDQFAGLADAAEAFDASNPTTEAASAAVDIPVNKPLTKAQRNREAKRQQAAQSRANLEAGLAGLPTPTQGAFPDPATMPDVVPVTATAEAVIDETATAPTATAPTATPEARVDEFIGSITEPTTTQRDLDVAVLGVLERVRQTKDAKSREEAVQLQKDMLLDEYLALIELTLEEGKVPSKAQLFDILKRQGLETRKKKDGTPILDDEGNAIPVDVSLADLGFRLKRRKDIKAGELEEAIVNFLGPRAKEARDIRETLTEGDWFDALDAVLTATKEEAKLAKFESLLGAVTALGMGSPEVETLLSEYGLPDSAAVLQKVKALRNQTRRRTQDETDRALAAFKKGQEETKKKAALSPREQREAAAEVRRLAGTERIGFKRTPVEGAPSYIAEEPGLVGPPSPRRERKGARIIRRKKPLDPVFARKRPEAVSAPKKDEEGKVIPGEGVVTVSEETARKIPETTYSPPAKDLETYQESEEFYTLVFKAFTMSDMGQNMKGSFNIEEEDVKDSQGNVVLDEEGKPKKEIRVVIGPEGQKGSVSKMLDRLFPDATERAEAAQYYEQDYYEKNKLLDDKAIEEIKVGIARRRVAKDKGTYYDANGNEAIKRDKKGKAILDENGNTIPTWPETVSAEELSKETAKIRSFSPSGTYVIRHKPTRNTTFGFRTRTYEVYNKITKQKQTVDDLLLDREGYPIPYLITHSRNVTQFPDRLFLYDSSDQVVLEQFVDDQRAVKLRSELDALLREFGQVKDVPLKRLAELASRFHIRSNFVGAVTTKGRATFIPLEGINTPQPPSVEMWFKPPKGASKDDFLSLDGMSQLYQELIKLKTLSPDRAWAESLKYTLEQLQLEANIRADLIIKNNPLANKAELKKLLKDNDAVFDKKRIAQITDFANAHKDFITDPTAENISIPSGDVVGVKQIWNSLSQSVSLGYRVPVEIDQTLDVAARAAETPYFETEASFIARASNLAVEPKQLEVGTKVSITAGGWKNVFQEEGSQVRLLSEKLQKLRIRRERMPGYVAGEEAVVREKVRVRTVEGGWKEVEKDRVVRDEKLDALMGEIEETQIALEKAIGDMIDREYNLAGHKGDDYILQPVGGGKKFSVPKKYVGVKKFSAKGVNRVQANELYSIRNRVREVAEHHKGGVASTTAQEKISSVILGAREEIKYRRAEIIDKKADGELSDQQYQSQMEKLFSDRQMLIWEGLAGRLHEGVPLLPITEALQERVDKEIASAARSLKIKDWRKAYETAVVKERVARGSDEVKLIKAYRKAYRKATDEHLKVLLDALSKEPRFDRIARTRRERKEDHDLLRITSLRTTEGGWRDIEVVGELVRDINESLRSTSPMVGAAGKNLIRRRLTDKQLPQAYKMLKKLWADLLFLRQQRVSGALEYEGEAYPSKWANGRYWEFVESADLVTENALSIMQTAASEMSILPSIRDGVVYAGRLSKKRKAGIEMGYYINAVPVRRWKNAYGVIIDKIRFNYVPTGGDMWHGPYEIWEVFEVNDPYSPNEMNQYNSFEEARKIFGKEDRYKSLPAEVKEFPVNANILTRREIKKSRAKGNATSVSVKDPSLTTNEVMEGTVEVKIEYHSPTSKKDRIVVTEESTIVVDEMIGREAESKWHKKPTKAGARSQADIVKDIQDTQQLLDAASTEIQLLKDTRLTKKRMDARRDEINSRIGEYKSKIAELKQEQLTSAPSGTQLYSLALTSETSDDGTTHVIYAEEGEGGSTVAEVSDTLAEAFGRQIFQFVRVVQSAHELPVDVQLNRMGFETDVRGVSFNNQIWLVADDLPANRVVPVALHEIGAHGFQAVMGKRFYQKLMKQIALMVNTDPEIKGIYDSIKAENPSLKDPILLEETMAYIVEREAMVNNPFWRAVVDAILYGLARLKLWINPKKIGTKDILIFAKAAARKHAREAKDRGSVYAANFLNTFLYSGELGADSSSESASANRLVDRMRIDTGPHMEMGFVQDWFLRDHPLAKKFIENFFLVRDVRRFPAVEGKRVLFGRYQVFAGHNFVKWVVDYFDILERLEESIKRRGGDINEKNMPSLFHGAYKNIVNYLRRSFHNTMVQPLADYMKLHNIDGEDLHMYLYATHAPHRNRVKAKTAEEKQLPNASGMWNTEEDARVGNARWRKIHEEKGTFFQDQTSSEAELNRLRNTLGDKKYEHLAKAAQYIYKINQANLARQLESGMITKEIMAKSEMYSDPDAYATYVPLRGENIVVADEFFEVPIGPSKLGVYGPESKRARGRYSPAENTWAWSIMQMDYEIDRIEKNKVILSFAQLIKDNEENLKDFATIVSLKEYQDHEIADTGKLILGLYPQKQTDPDTHIHFKSNGESFVILVTDKRIGQAFNRTNMTDSGAFLQLTSQINRYFSAIHTSINPEFVLTNFVRDFQTAMANLQGLKETVGEFKDTEALGKKVFKDIKKAGVGLKNFIIDKKTDTEWARLAEEFSAQGGRIDFFAFKDVRDFEKTLTDYIKDTTPAGARRWKNKMLDFVAEYNAVVENTMRLATYKNAKEAFIQNGMDEASAMRRAADISRNLTVNFSQKGEKGAALNSLYLFFNASVQGTVRLMQALFRRPTSKKGMTRVQKIAGGIMLYSFTQSILNAMLAGDDEDGVNRWRQVDMRSRGRQLHIYIPGFDTFFKIPLPYGYNFFHAMGDTIASVMMGHANPGRGTMHLVSTAAESFMPFSFGTSDNLFRAAVQTITPTFADPAVELALNENYFGQPIYKDPQWGSSDPPSERYWSSTGPITKGISRSLNWLSGGSRAEAGLVSIPPDIFEYFWETFGGGAARFVERSTDLVMTIGPARLTHRETGDVKWTKVPFARRFFFDETASKKRFTYDKYSQYEKDIRTAVGMDKGILEIYGRGKDYDNFKESDDYKLFKLDSYRKSIVGQITKLQKQRNKILNNRVLRNDIKEERVNRLEDRMMELRIKLINKVDEDIFEK